MTKDLKPISIRNVAILTSILTVGFTLTCASGWFITKFFYPTVHIAF